MDRITELTQEQWEAQRKQLAFQAAHTVINKLQSRALDDLLWEGKLRGTRYPDVEPPRSVAVFGMDDRDGMEQWPSENRAGEFIRDPEDPLLQAVEDMEPTHTLAVLSSDGRMWNIVRAGICRPIPPPSEGA